MSDTTKTLQVNITGTANSGKTTLAQAIEDLCKAHGVDVVFNDKETAPWAPRKELVNLAGKVTVVITETQAPRPSLWPQQN